MKEDNLSEPAQGLLTRKQAAEYLGYTEATLAMWKCTKRYPLPYVKIGINIRYRLSDLNAFIEKHLIEE